MFIVNVYLQFRVFLGHLHNQIVKQSVVSYNISIKIAVKSKKEHIKNIEFPTVFGMPPFALMKELIWHGLHTFM